MEKTEFEELVAQGFESIPEKFRAKIKNVALLVEDEPSLEIRRRERLADDETLLGYYHGVPNTIRGAEYGVGAVLPDTITLFQIPIEEEARYLAESVAPEERDEAFRGHVRAIVADTVWHEYAHYFGMDEHEVRFKEQVRKKLE